MEANKSDQSQRVQKRQVEYPKVLLNIIFFYSKQQHDLLLYKLPKIANYL